MKKRNNGALFIVIILIVAIIALKFSGLFSIFSGTVSGSRFIYVNTYEYANQTKGIIQIPATVTLNNYSCSTSLSNFNLGYPVAEVDLPVLGLKPINQYYSTGSSAKPIALCEITLNTASIGNTIILNVKASNSTANLYSANYSINATISPQTSSSSPIMITLPMQNQGIALLTSTISTSTTTTSMSTSTTSNNPAGNSTVLSTSTTTTIAYYGNGTTQIGLIQQIINWLQNLISQIVHSFG